MGTVDEEHYCHVPRCTIEIDRKFLMCPYHWNKVPKIIQARVWAAYRPGQETDRRPSPQWRQAAKEAIKAVIVEEAGQVG